MRSPTPGAAARSSLPPRRNVARALGVPAGVQPTATVGYTPTADGTPTYLAANKNMVLTFAGTGSGQVVVGGSTVAGEANPRLCTATCTVAFDNSGSGTLTA